MNIIIEHNITPRGVQKAIKDIMEGAYSSNSVRGKLYSKTAEPNLEYLAMSPEALKKKIAQLEKEMYEHAHNLEFEEAGRLRDHIHEIEKMIVER